LRFESAKTGYGENSDPDRIMSSLWTEEPKTFDAVQVSAADKDPGDGQLGSVMLAHWIREVSWTR